MEVKKLPPEVIEAFRKLYKAPDMPEAVILAKIQGAKQFKESQRINKESEK